MNEKIGRNDPCPCGSGKKYKQCHWGQEIKKTYTSAGKRKIRAKVLSMADRSQSIFSQSASTQKIVDEPLEPGTLLKFRQSSTDYRRLKKEEVEKRAAETVRMAPIKEQEVPLSLDLPFEVSGEDYRKKEKEQ